MSALKLDGVVDYDASSAERFRGVLASLGRCCGETLASGVLYWATDPFDNPDYEEFLRDWVSVVGSRPQTTTAQPLRHADRVRRLIEGSWSSPMATVRISVLSTPVLQRLHAQFTPEELIATKLEMHTRTARTGLQATGRARDVRDPSRAERIHTGPTGTDTIACMSGFLVNFGSGRVQLIAPCAATDRWPNGYRVFADDTFADATEFDAALDRMLTHVTRSALTPDAAVRMRDVATCLPAFDGFDVVTRTHVLKLRSRPGLAHIGDLLQHGATHTVGEILDACTERGVAPQHAIRTLEWLDELAVFADRDASRRRGGQLRTAPLAARSVVV